MYIYHALINAQSTHIMHIDLNMNEQCCCSSFDTIHTQWTTFKVRRKSKRSWKVTVFRCEWDQLSICCPSLGYGAQLAVEECHFKSRCNVLCNIVLACSLCCIKLYYSLYLFKRCLGYGIHFCFVTSSSSFAVWYRKLQNSAVKNLGTGGLKRHMVYHFFNLQVL